MLRKPMSITLRLACLFAAVAAITFAAAGTYLYRALDQQLQWRDDQELIGKVSLVRHLLEEAQSVDNIAQSPHPFLDVVVGHRGLVLRLVRSDGRILLQSAAPSRPLPNIVPVSAEREPDENNIGNWKPAAGSGRIVVAMGTVGSAKSDEVKIILAQEESERGALLRDYRRTLGIVVVFGAALAASAGLLIVRLGLRPLQHIIAKANDITTHRLDTRLRVREAPIELQELGAAFNAMLDRLEDGVQRLSRFSADLAHDLRTPINTLMMETQVALSRPRECDEYQLLLASNYEEFERLARMIENTLFLARADNAQLAIRREQLIVDRELLRIGDYFEGLADEAGITFTVKESQSLVLADPILLQRAISNLVANAITHTPRGGSVMLRAQTQPDCVEIVVENSGPGIAPEHLPHIFDRYYRADLSRAASTQSSGLGLAIVRAIMHLHDGDVQVRSSHDDRTIFVLRFV